MSPKSQTWELCGPTFTRAVTVAVVVGVSLLAFYTRDCFVDDAFIGFQHLKNLMNGEGFTFFAGQPPVEGVTNIGWLLVLALPVSLVKPVVAAKCLGLGLLMASIAATVALGRKLSAKLDDKDPKAEPTPVLMPQIGIPTRDAALRAVMEAFSKPPPGPVQPADYLGLTVAPLVLLASSFEFVYFALAGMETGLLAGVLLSMALVAMGRPTALTLPLLGAFAFLVHPEAVAVYPLFAVLSCIGQRQMARKLLVGNVVLLVAIGIITAARFAYFGDVVPNTFHSKPSNLGLVVRNGCDFLMGRNTNVPFPITGWLAIPLLGLGYWRLRQVARAGADTLAAICVAGLIFAVYSQADWTSLPRYFAPYLPAVLVLLWCGVTWAVEGGFALARRGRSQEDDAESPASVRGIRGTLVAVTMVLLGVNVLDAQSKLSQLDTFPGYVLAGKTLAGAAESIREYVPRDDTIATRRIGALAYVSERRVFDYTYGLTDRDVAQLVGARGARFDLPTDPGLASVWRARRPNYFLEDATTLNYILAQTGGTRNHFSIHGMDYRVIHEFPIGKDAKWVLAKRRPAVARYYGTKP